MMSEKTMINSVALIDSVELPLSFPSMNFGRVVDLCFFFLSLSLRSSRSEIMFFRGHEWFFTKTVQSIREIPFILFYVSKRVRVQKWIFDFIDVFFFEFEHLLKKNFSYDHVLKLNRMKKLLIPKILIKNKENHCVSVICCFRISFDLLFDLVLLWLSDWCYYRKLSQKRKITEYWSDESWLFQSKKWFSMYIWMCQYVPRKNHNWIKNE